MDRYESPTIMELDETERFILRVGPGAYDTPFKGKQIYQVVNKITDVIEAEGPNEVIARATLQDVQVQYDSYVASLVEGVEEVPAA